MIKRVDRLEVSTSDLNDAAQAFERNFGFTVERPADDAHSAAISIGSAEIRLVSRQATAGEAAADGMTGLWLEAEDIDEVACVLGKAGVAHSPVRREGDRRVLGVDASAANAVPLFIFDRKG
jgi:Glyoxalase/Bleomycin resistance protein/Dioxygenase superfamily